MSGLNRRYKCKDCGDDTSGAWAYYCDNCRRKRADEARARRRKAIADGTVVKHCRDCGAQITNLASRCRSCNRRNYFEQVKINQLREELLQAGPPPGGYAISDPGWFRKWSNE